MSRIDVVYAASMKPGDLFAGIVAPEAPTRPVQEWAAALKLASVTPYTSDDGRRMVALETEHCTLSPLPIVTQCLLIRI